MANSLLDGAAFFTGLHVTVEKANRKALTRSARMIRDEARRVLGTYEYGWPALKPATIARKATGDSPGLETGEMRMSIKYSVSHGVATVGSNNPKALWFELGTIHMPPRSFLVGAAVRMEKEIHKTCGGAYAWALGSKHPDFEDEWSYDGED